MKKRLTHVSPLQCGIVLAALYFCVSLLFVPFMLLMTVIAAQAPHDVQHPNPFASMGLVFIFIIPIFYTAIGFVGGIIVALIYNLIAKMTGGLEFTTVEVASATPPAVGYPAN